MTDSASDISCADEQKYSIEAIPFPVTLGERTYLSRVDFNNEQFFSLMAQYEKGLSVFKTKVLRHIKESGSHLLGKPLG